MIARLVFLLLFCAIIAFIAVLIDDKNKPKVGW